MGMLAVVHYSAGARAINLDMLVGSFAATAVLVFAVPDAPLSQPRNVLCGHAVSAIIGVAVRMIVADSGRAGAEPAAVAVAVALSVWAMSALCVTHPPGGATALIAVVGGDSVRALGWLYVLDVILGAAILVMVAVAGHFVLIGARVTEKSYPKFWLY
jgi:CBS-domain-containing membrane protein